MRPAEAIDQRRRTLLVASLTAGGSLAIGGVPMLDAMAAGAGADAAAGGAALVPNQFLRIGRDGRVVLIVPYIEMGQGNYTSQAMIVAEELEVAPESIVLEEAPADAKRYGTPFLAGEQLTGGSASMISAWTTMRPAAAAARVLLVQAAAQQWNVPASECAAANGQVVHQASGRKIGYGQLTAAAAKLPVPKDVAPKESGFKVIGKTMRRVDMAGKVDGSAKFAIDTRVPGMHYAIVRACPVFSGKLRSVDGAAALRVKGVRQVVKLDDAVAVVADSTWQALKGMDLLKITWDEGANANVSTADIVAGYDAALDQPGLVFRNDGDVRAAEARGGSRYEAVFRLPALAHVPMEPINCTVHVRADGCDVWCGSQAVGRAGQVAAQASGLPVEKVRVHNQLLGGGFGRRLEVDFVTQAVLIGRQVKGPVKVTWTRAEDIQHDYYRGHNHSRITVMTDAKGMPQSWRHHVVGPNVMARFLPAYQKDNIDLDIVENAIGAYDIPNVFIDFTRHESPEGMHTGNWRGVGPSRNLFMAESVIDDLAARAKMDPIAYRRAMLGKASPRLRKVLDLAEAKSDWGKPLPPRSGRGIALFEAFRSFLAIVAQVKVLDSGEIRVERMTCVIDTGVVVNPDIVRAQMEGGMMFGISSALHERITVANGRVEQANYDAYPVLRIKDAPPHVDVVIVDSTEKPGGVGEPGTSGAFPAVANAVFAATGVRSYSLPLDPANFKVKS